MCKTKRIGLPYGSWSRLTPGVRQNGGIELHRDVVLVLPNLGVGGAQAVATYVAAKLHEDGWNVEIVLLEDRPTLIQTVHPNIPVFRLSLQELPVTRRTFGKALRSVVRHLIPIRVREEVYKTMRSPKSRKFSVLVPAAITQQILLLRWKRRAKVRRLRRLLEDRQPTTIISFLSNTNIHTIFASRGLESRVVVCERNDVQRQKHSLSVELVRPMVYPQADLITTNYALDEKTAHNLLGTAAVTELPNPLMVSRSSSDELRRDQVFLYVGRLTAQKNVEALIVAAAMISHKVREKGWRIDIVGDGPSRVKLERLSSTAGIADLITFVGHVNNSAINFSASSLLVLPSHYEGAPNVVLEAFAHGLPAIVSSTSGAAVGWVNRINPEMVFPTEDPAVLASLMSEWIDRGGADESMHKSVRELAVGYEWQNVRDRWYSALDLPILER